MTTRICSALLLIAAPSLWASDLRLGAGYEYSTGDYGLSQDTRQHAVPLSVSWYDNGWLLQASTSYISRSGPESVVVYDGGATVVGEDTTTLRRDAGLGDTTLGVRRELSLGAEQGIYLDLGMSVRLPTASSSTNIISRSADYSLTLDAYTPYDRWLPFASIGYKWMGDSASFTPDNIAIASLGVQYQLNPACVTGAIMDYQQAISSSSEPLQELYLYANCHLSPQWAVSPYLLKGFSDSSLDYGAGLQVFWYPFR